jgi:type IV pilus assembly protein PilV
MKKNTGFTLIEVLVAMLVLAVALLGLAGLQAASLKNNQSAYNRSQASQLAYDIADRMRANSTESHGYTSIQAEDAVKKDQCTQVSTSCTTADMASNDLYEWNLAIKNSLPSTPNTPATGAITTSGNGFTAIIRWDDDRDGDIDNDDPNLQTDFVL